jgi:CRISPR/Cas system Type II protein with McrA/HNH and RuvC-like nuclease domain
LEKQNYRCAYTGELLVVGEQKATIDHKRPISRGGDDSVDNLHWITKRMNEMKGAFTHEEFLETCQTITEIWQKKQNQLRIA